MGRSVCDTARALVIRDSFISLLRSPLELRTGGQPAATQGPAQASDGRPRLWGTEGGVLGFRFRLPIHERL